jgi:hypothetical protein
MRAEAKERYEVVTKKDAESRRWNCAGKLLVSKPDAV